MSFLHIFKSKPKNVLTVGVKVPGSVSIEDLSLGVELTFASTGANTISGLIIRLRGDLVDRKQAPGAPPSHVLGELITGEDIKLAPNKPEQHSFKLPLDFSPLNSYEIPPENMTIASDAMKAAAEASKSAVYSFTVVITAKSSDDNEIIKRVPIQVIDPNSIRTSSF
jgi:hypothetical protein